MSMKIQMLREGWAGPALKLRNTYNAWERQVGWDHDAPVGVDFSFQTPKRIHIEHLETFDLANRNKGFARTIMKKLCRLADQFGVALTLEPAPLDDETPNLYQFYSKFGFERYKHGMIRNPNS